MAQKPKTTIVRAADGTLWAVSKDGTVKPLDDKDAKKVEEIVAPGGPTEQNLEAIVNQAMSQVAAGCTQRVHIAIPDVDV
jgi:hypothetical protein